LSKPDFSPKPRWGRPKTALKVFPIGMTKLYQLINSGDVRSKKVGSMRLIDLESLERLGDDSK
jgi:hypothetical protein